MPLQVRGDSQDVLVVYLTSTAHTHCDSRLLCVREGGVVGGCINVTLCGLLIPMTSELNPHSPLQLKERKCLYVRTYQNKHRYFQICYRIIIMEPQELKISPNNIWATLHARST